MDDLIFSHLRLWLIAMLLHIVAGSASAQRTVFEAELKDAMELAENTNVTNTTKGFEDWELNHCIIAKDYYNELRFQIGQEANTGGYAITPNLTGLEGNARIMFYAYAIGTDGATLKLSVVGDGELSSEEISVQHQWKIAVVLLRGGNASTRLRFESMGNTDKRIMVARILVTDIDDGFFYESFNNIEATGGNDATYAAKSSASTPAPVAVSASNMDNSGCTIESKSYIDKASHCIYFESEAKTLTLPAIAHAPAGGIAILTFKAAGANYMSSYVALSVTADASVDHSRIEVESGKWSDCLAIISNFSPTTKVAFSGNCYFLDDVMISTPTALALSQQEDSGTDLLSLKGKYADVSMVRTLLPDIWNTLCLPFDFSSEMLPEGITCEIKVLDGVSENVFQFKDATRVTAGHPFLIKVDQEVVNPEFRGVLIASSAPTEDTGGSEGYAFRGTFSPVDLATDGTNVFLATNGLLYRPASSTRRMAGYRAYFVVPSAEASSVRMSFTDDFPIVTHLSATDTKERSAAIYTLQGQRISGQAPAKGIYISSGKKVLKK